MKKLFLIGLVALSAVGFTQELKVKSEGTKISFVADMQKTAGTISGFEATIKLDLENIENSTISGSVDVNTLNTGTAKRDDHLKSDDYFDAAKFPKMSFTSTSIKKEGDQYVMMGNMTIKDITREEKITFTYTENVFKASCTIQLAHYKVGNFGDQKPEKTNVNISFEIHVTE